MSEAAFSISGHHQSGGHSEPFAATFSCVELNRTFYKLPMVKTTRKWREEMPEDFVFTVKAWQAITHPTSGVTWRKRKEKLSEEQAR